MRDEVTALRVAVQAMERHLNARIERLEHRLLARLGGLVVVMTGIILAALRYLPLAHE